MPVHVHLAEFLAGYVAPYATETEALEIAIELGQTVTLAYGNYDPEDLTAPIVADRGRRMLRREGR